MMHMSREQSNGVWLCWEDRVNMKILYMFPGSSECRKRKAELVREGQAFTERNLYSNRLKEAEIRYLIRRCQGDGAMLIRCPEKICRLTGKTPAECSESDYVNLIRKNPTLLNAPIVLSSGQLEIGPELPGIELEIHLENLPGVYRDRLERRKKRSLLCAQPSVS